MSWQELSVKCHAESLALIEDLLRLAGAHSVSVRDAGDHALLEPEPGTAPVWPVVVVSALFDNDSALASLANLLGATDNALGEPDIRAIEDQDWLAASRQAFEPVEVGKRLRIVPADETSSVAAPDELAIGMGLAFGTGQHPTTRLCLDWLAELPEVPESVLDYGCGSGILALAALKCGAEQAWAVDNDPQALLATAANAEHNGLRTRIWIGKPESLPPVTTGLVFANILAGTLIHVAPRLARLGDGLIGLSGILQSQQDQVRSAYEPYYDQWQTRSRDGWCLLTATRRQAADHERSSG